MHNIVVKVNVFLTYLYTIRINNVLIITIISIESFSGLTDFIHFAYALKLAIFSHI